MTLSVVRSAGPYTRLVSPTRTKPVLPEEERWALELMDERLRNPWQTPERLLERARELRDEAGETEIAGTRDAALLLAERYEQAAAQRVGSR